MIIKKFFAILVEIITGRHCSKCRHYAADFCYHPDGYISRKCQRGIFPVGYEERGD